MIEPLQRDSRALGFKLSGKLHDEDYKHFVPLVDAAIAREGKVRLLAWFHDFHGWDMHALWDDIKFSTTHCARIERIALVGKYTQLHDAYFSVTESLRLAAAFNGRQLDLKWINSEELEVEERLHPGAVARALSVFTWAGLLLLAATLILQDSLARRVRSDEGLNT